MGEKIRDLVEMIYIKMQINEEEMEQEEVEKKIRIPRYMYKSSDLREKLNIVSFSPDKLAL